MRYHSTGFAIDGGDHRVVPNTLKQEMLAYKSSKTKLQKQNQVKKEELQNERTNMEKLNYQQMVMENDRKQKVKSL